MSQDFIIKIRVTLAKHKKNQAWLAKQLNISTPYMSDIMNGRRSPTAKANEIQAVLDGLESEVEVSGTNNTR